MERLARAGAVRDAVIVQALERASVEYVKRKVEEERRRLDKEKKALEEERRKLEEERQRLAGAKGKEQEKGPSQPDSPARVVGTTPEHESTNVPFSLKEIVIVFDQPMNSGWNINCSPAFFPDAPEGRRCTDAGPYWRNDRTYVIPLPSGLKPSQRYSFTINPWVGLERFKLETSFRGLGQSQPVPPQRFFFTTGQ
ncbi:MAG: Ig-like domain-containing protein [Deltaproteobacteria bacterium]|nr:Ig-like domain-containing protein [Deltaproteobacteria bacterium]